MNEGMRREIRISMIRYHGLDHWPFTLACWRMPYGGGFHHLRLAWSYRRRERVLRLWYRWRCWQGKHEDTLYSVGHNPGKMCWHCQRPGILTPEEIEDMQSNWPTWLEAPGDEQ